MYIYYPSCNYQRFFPETAAKARTYLEKQSDVAIAGCCHKTADRAQQGDSIVTVCLSCMRTLDEVREDVPGISLYELLLTREDFPWPDYGGREMTLQDCFRARGKHSLQDAVRECLHKMNITVRELEKNRDDADYDGSFLLHNPYPHNMQEAPRYYADYLPRHVTLIPEEGWLNVYRKQVSLYQTKAVVTYCNTCCRSARDGDVEKAHEIYHLTELIFA